MPDSNGMTISISLWILTVVPLLFMLLRFYCKSRNLNAFGLDDWLLALSWILVLAYTATLQVAVNYGIGKRFDDIDRKIRPTAVMYMYIGEFFGFFAMPIGKTSFCVTLLRLTTVRWQRWILWFIMISFNTTMSVYAIAQWAQCRPVQKLWNPTLDGKCWPYDMFLTFGIVIGAYSALADFVLAICPWLIIRKVQMRENEKWSLVIAMSMGCLAGVCCIVKTSYIPAAATWEDFTYSVSNLLIWALAESSITIVAASLPFLRLLLKNMSSHSGSQGLKGSIPLPDRSRDVVGLRSQQKSHRDHAAYAEEMKGDEASDKSILARTRKDFSKIVRSHEVRVEYGEVGDNAGPASQGKDTWKG